MTRYDGVIVHPDAGGGLHPLAGVPQEALDAAVGAFEAALTDRRTTNTFNPLYDYEFGIDLDEIEPAAHAVLLAAIVAVEKLKTAG